MKYHVKINDIIRYMDANNLVHMKDKIIYYTSFERPWIAVQTKIRITSICLTIWEILALVLEKWDISSKKKSKKNDIIRHMDANNSVHIKVKINSHTAFERP